MYVVKIVHVVRLQFVVHDFEGTDQPIRMIQEHSIPVNFRKGRSSTFGDPELKYNSGTESSCNLP